LAARLRPLSPDSLGELERSPRPLSRNWGSGSTSKGKRGERRGKGERGGDKREGIKGRVRGVVASSFLTYGYGPVNYAKFKVRS